MNQIEAQDDYRRIFRWTVTAMVVLIIVWGVSLAAQRVLTAGEARLLSQQTRQFQLQLRLLNNLWQSAGQPEQLFLTAEGLWELGTRGQLTPVDEDQMVEVNALGWPVVSTSAGCQQLWDILLGQSALSASYVNVEFNADEGLCRYWRNEPQNVLWTVGTSRVERLDITH